MDAVVVEGLVKDYGGGRQQKRALDHVSFRLPSASMFGLVGPNGAGKTTLLKVLLGVVHPSAGTVRVLGGDPLDPQVRRRMGYLPERLALPVSWKPLPFLHSIARLKGVSASGNEALIERVGLAAQRDARIGTYSKGMRQRLGLAAALIGAPDLIVLDEPTDGIDPQGRADVRKLLQQECARGATVFLNSHLLTETERICDQVGFLVRGTLRRFGAMAEVRNEAVTDVWHVRFAAGIDPQALIALGFAPVTAAHTFRFQGDATTLNACLAHAREHGAVLLELVPQLRDLEALFIELTRGDA